MVVHSISATATPPRSSTNSYLAFRMKQRKGGAGLSSARRALSALGRNNVQINLRLAESLLTITQEKFMNKWNFDPVKETPLAPGRFQWASVSSIGAKPEADAPTTPQEPSITANRDISTCFILPMYQVNSTRVPEPLSSTTSTNVAEADSGAESKDFVIEEREGNSTEKEDSATASQTNKLKRSSSHLENSLQVPAFKKILLLVN